MMPEPEEKDEAQDARSVLEAAYDEALKPEPDEEITAEVKAEEPEEKPAEEVTAEARPEPGDPLPEEKAEEVEEPKVAGRSPPLAGRASRNVPGPGPQGAQSFLMDRSIRTWKRPTPGRTLRKSRR